MPVENKSHFDSVDAKENRELREAVRALERQTRVFDTALSSIADFAYIFNKEGRFVFANQALADLLGLTPDAIVGKDFLELGYPPELAEKLQQQIRRVFETKELVRDETPFTSPTGQPGYYEYILRPVLARDGSVETVVGSTRDLTERKKAEEAFRESERRFRLLVEGTPDYAMLLLDRNNKITFWSTGAERVFGWSAEEAVGQAGNLIFTREDREKGVIEKELGIARARGHAPDRRWLVRKDGTRIWVDGVMHRIDDKNGELGGFAKVARDASDQRRIEDELRHARDEFEQRVVERTADLMATNNVLERTMAQRTQLERELLEISEREKRRIGDDLHDVVCQELTATALFLKSMATKLAKESPAAAATLNESAQLVNRNVGLARDLARGLQPAEVDAAGLKAALKSLATQACEKTEIKCHFKAARGVRVSDNTVALHLYRIVQEALNNALKHSGAENILVILDRSEENICVTVEDDGKGLKPKKREKGLGLHIMRYRANALGGKLIIEQRKRGGTEVRCVIPAKK